MTLLVAMKNCVPRFVTLLTLLTLLLLGCGNADGPDNATADTAGVGSAEGPSGAHDSLRESLTFYASFDDGDADADYAQGDPTVFTAPSWTRRAEGTAGLPGDTLIAHVPGVHGDAIHFVNGSPSILYYQGRNNIVYEPQSWSGTISFWLNLDPEEELDPGFTDPLQISPNQWNDAALFVDFTEENPRQFRFASFADYEVWNPDDLEWDEIAVDDRPMVAVDDHPFERGEWTHVVMTFDRYNTGDTDGVLTSYLNGEPHGTLTGREQTFTWDLDETIIALGLNFVGRFDELSLYDRALEPEEVQALYELEGGMPSLL